MRKAKKSRDILKRENHINRLSKKRVILQEKDNMLVNEIQLQEKELFTYKIQKYNSADLRKDICKKAIENNYPRESLQQLDLYNENVITWDIANVTNDVIDTLVGAELFNRQASKNKRWWKKFGTWLLNIFKEGGV